MFQKEGPRPTRVRIAGPVPGPAVMPSPTGAALTLALETCRTWHKIPSASLPWKCLHPDHAKSGRFLKGWFFPVDGMNMIQHKQSRTVEARLLQAHCLPATRQGPQTAPTGGDLRGAHGGRVPCHSSLQEHHHLASCQEQPSPWTSFPGIQSRGKQSASSRGHANTPDK